MQEPPPPRGHKRPLGCLSQQSNHPICEYGLGIPRNNTFGLSRCPSQRGLYQGFWKKPGFVCQDWASSGGVEWTTG